MWRTWAWRTALAASIAALPGGLVAYLALDLREPRHTREALAAFERNEPGAWDDYKMDPPASERAVPALLEGLRSPNPTVRERALAGVCGLSRAPAVVSAIQETTRDSVQWVRESAESCIRITYGIRNADQ